MRRFYPSTSSWIAVDWAVAAYTLGVGVLVWVRAGAIQHAPLLLAAHGALLAILVALPARGSQWEQANPADPRWLRVARSTGRFLRYTYPALLLTPFFEEVQLTVNAISPDSPYWFERHLYAADRALLGATPAVAMVNVTSRPLDELMHAFYVSYYPMIVAGIVIAWRGPTRNGPTPGTGFHTVMTSMMLGFFFAYVWYPFLPARGPWENPQLMSELRGFDGLVFPPLVDWIMAGAAVSGACFPSAHVSGTIGLLVGLAKTHRKAVAWLGPLAAGLVVACVYTRYHHAVDVVAGAVVGLAGGWLGRALTRRQ